MNTYTITINLRVQAENTPDAISISEAYINQLNQENDCNAMLCSMYRQGVSFQPPNKIFDGELEFKEVKHSIYKQKKQQ